jgi:hypothetical protein
MELSEEDLQNLKSIEYYEKFTWYKEVAKLKAGNAFGDLAHLNK